MTAVDIDADRIAAWNSNHLPINEPGLAEILQVVQSHHPFVEGSHSNGYHSSHIPVEEARCHSHRKDEQRNVVGRPPNLFFSTNINEATDYADIIFITVSTLSRVRFALLPPLSRGALLNA